MAKRGRPRKNPVEIIEKKEPCGLDALFEREIAAKKGVEKIAVVNSEIQHDKVEVTSTAIVQVHYACLNPDCPSKRGFDCFTDSVATVCPLCKGDKLIIDSITALKERIKAL